VGASSASEGANRAPIALTAIELFQALAYGADRHGLARQIDAGLDAQAAFENSLTAEGVEEVAAHLLGEVGGVRVGELPGLIRRLRALHAGGLVGLVVDVALGQHAIEHIAASLLRLLGVSPRGIPRGSLREPGQLGGLGDRELGGRLAEVAARGLGQAVGAVSEVDLVEIEVEDLLLREPLLDVASEDHLSDLASDRALRVQEQALHHLLGDRAPALTDLSPGQQVLPGGAQDRLVVDPGVLEEGAVLRRDERTHHVLGDLVEGDEEAALVEEFTDPLAVAVVDYARQGRSVVLHAPDVRKIADEGEVEADAGRERAQTQQASRPRQPAQEPRAPPSVGTHCHSGGFCDRSRRRAPCATASARTRAGLTWQLPPRPTSS
jgi:hypothetical protein